MSITMTWTAGWYEQCAAGWRLVTLSRHSRRELAERAARRYARQLRLSGAIAGGAYSWSAWFRDGEKPVIRMGGV